MAWKDAGGLMKTRKLYVSKSELTSTFLRVTKKKWVPQHLEHFCSWSPAVPRRMLIVWAYWIVDGARKSGQNSKQGRERQTSAEWGRVRKPFKIREHAITAVQIIRNFYFRRPVYSSTTKLRNLNNVAQTDPRVKQVVCSQAVRGSYTCKVTPSPPNN